MIQNVKIVVAISLVVIFTIVQQIAARPKANAFQNSLDTITGCHIDSKLQDTCQRCAKQTKSNVVYPMCCSNEDDVFVWCQRYIGYGIH
ncbi:hypothetical protein RN001_015557 [Aquatica leii]|uniref:Secreted protein n=1 Tax=Aquatica leii TaxID=1421715 RepID=A0AAN7QCP7_9COLE|nr:hypothetical protein RN001_015557 [Aquatica leii]